MDITINDVVFKAEEYECSLVSVKMGDEVRTLDGVDHSEGRKLKRRIRVTFSDKSSVETSQLIQKLYVKSQLTVSYIDTPTNTVQERVFALKNDPTAPKILWKPTREYYKGIEVELLEVGAE